MNENMRLGSEGDNHAMKSEGEINLGEGMSTHVQADTLSTVCRCSRRRRRGVYDVGVANLLLVAVSIAPSSLSSGNLVR